MKIMVWDLIESVSNALDMINSSLSDHHGKVAYISMRIGTMLGMSNNDIERMIYAALLHDCGVFTGDEANSITRFEFDTTANNHAEIGSKLLKGLTFIDISEIVRFHHTSWKHGEGSGTGDGRAIPFTSHIIHLADRVATLSAVNNSILLHSHDILETVEAHTDAVFHPDIVAAFHELAQRDSFWLDMNSNDVKYLVNSSIRSSSIDIGIDELYEFSRLISNIIDYKCRFTATHSIGVARVAQAVSRKIGFSSAEGTLFEIAGHLHDLGKLSVPAEILYKPASLNREEMAVMRSHSYITFAALRKVRGMENVVKWACEHHEKLDGSGYPFRRTDSELSLGSRVMAVADIFTALSEDRPYRKGMCKRDTISTLNSLTGTHLDPYVTSTLISAYDEINDIRALYQKNAFDIYMEVLN